MNSQTLAKDLKADIIIIGGGGTGLAAALTVAQRGATAVVLEKRGTTGGTSVFASGLFAADSPAQKRMGIATPKDGVFKLVMDYTHWEINPRIMRAFIEKSGDTIRWLEEMGLRFNDVGSMFPEIDLRAFHSLEPLKVSGQVIIKTLWQRCEDIGVRLLLSCPAEKILMDEKGWVNGVRAELDGEKVEISARSAIIATGGYTGNKELLEKCYPTYSDHIVFLGVPHTGDGYRMATEIGAATEGLGVLLLHPHIYRGSVQVDALAQEPTTIWVNKQGNRFTDETVTFKPTECGNTINRQLDKCVYVLLDNNLKQKIEEEGFIRGAVHGGTRGTHIPTRVRLSDLGPVLRSESAKGEVKISDFWEDIAAWISVPPEVLKATIDHYNQSCDRGYDEVFNKECSYLYALRTPPYYGIRCYLSCLDTIGGIKINHHMEVLDTLDNPIPGLYAGGDVAGGWETSTYCIRLPGSALSFAINSGRIAAENAANFIG